MLIHKQKRWAAAEPLYRKALTIYVAAFGEEHPDVGFVCSNLGELQRAQGHFEEAEPLYRRALAIDVKTHGERHRDVAMGCHALGTVLNKQGRVAEAAEAFDRAHSINLDLHGPAHASTQRSTKWVAHMRKAFESAADVCR